MRFSTTVCARCAVRRRWGHNPACGTRGRRCPLSVEDATSRLPHAAVSSPPRPAEAATNRSAASALLLSFLISWPCASSPARRRCLLMTALPSGVSQGSPAEVEVDFLPAVHVEEPRGLRRPCRLPRSQPLRGGESPGHSDAAGAAAPRLR